MINTTPNSVLDTTASHKSLQLLSLLLILFLYWFHLWGWSRLGSTGVITIIG